MRLRKLVLRELFERKSQVITGLMAILLGITVIVAIKNITFYSEKAVARELDALGANILVLPKSVTLQNYYSADMQGEEIPEEYVERLTQSNLQGVDNLSPKLSVPVEIQGHRFTLTGILPKSEFQAKAVWQTAGVFSRPEGCGTVASIPGLTPEPPKETLVRTRVIETLSSAEALVGADVAATLGVKANDTISVMGKTFTVAAVLPETGTVDDSRVFAHLHTVQEIAGKGRAVNVIEIVGCCDQISKGLASRINGLLPEAKVVTIAQVVDTQIKTNRMMSSLSMVFVAVIVLVGGASIANYMYGNVHERRREIGTLMALGAGSGLVLKMFLLKALLLGLAGGVAGYVLGTVLALLLGPKLAGIIVLPMPTLMPWAIGISVFIALVASYFPARRAAWLDPFATLQEV
ncbi:MAG: FtsX-like permease family protein [Thermodesulfobacteriota bacterium]